MREAVICEPIRTPVGRYGGTLKDLAPADLAAAVVHEPWGAFPSPVQGYYGRRHDFYHRFHEESRTPDGFRQWLDHWVHGVPDWKAFLSRLDAGVLDAVRVRHPLPSEPLDYGA